MVKRVLKWIGVALLVLFALALALALWPASTRGLSSTKHTVGSYSDAVEQIAQIRAQERREGVIKPCMSRLYTHGVKTPRSIVLIHGLTNCPKQWELFAGEIYKRGWNVLVLRLPEHGLGDPATGKIGSVSHLKHLNARTLARYGDRAVDLARPLGRRLDVMGLSLGGTIAAWIAQERPVSRVIVIAPGIGLPGMPYAVTWGVTNLFDHFPDLSIGHGGKLAHEYQGWSTGGIADTFVLGKYVRQRASHEAPAAKAIEVLLNRNDDTISNTQAENLVKRWRGRGHRVYLYWLPKQPVLGHDVIDPGQSWARPDIVYARLFKLLSLQTGLAGTR